MSLPKPVVSRLRQRMLDDMRMRQMAPKTQTGYVRAVCKLADFLERLPRTASTEDLRRFQLHLVDHGTSPITLNATISGLRFFFDKRVKKLSPRKASMDSKSFLPCTSKPR